MCDLADCCKSLCWKSPRMLMCPHLARPQQWPYALIWRQSVSCPILATSATWNACHEEVRLGWTSLSLKALLPGRTERHPAEEMIHSFRQQLDTLPRTKWRRTSRRQFSEYFLRWKKCFSTATQVPSALNFNPCRDVISTYTNGHMA